MGNKITHPNNHTLNILQFQKESHLFLSRDKSSIQHVLETPPLYNSRFQIKKSSLCNELCSNSIEEIGIELYSEMISNNNKYNNTLYHPVTSLHLSTQFSSDFIKHQNDNLKEWLSIFEISNKIKTNDIEHNISSISIKNNNIESMLKDKRGIYNNNSINILQGDGEIEKNKDTFNYSNNKNEDQKTVTSLLIQMSGGEEKKRIGKNDKNIKTGNFGKNDNIKLVTTENDKEISNDLKNENEGNLEINDNNNNLDQIQKIHRYSNGFTFTHLKPVLKENELDEKNKKNSINNINNNNNSKVPQDKVDNNLTMVKEVKHSSNVQSQFIKQKKYNFNIKVIETKKLINKENKHTPLITQPTTSKSSSRCRKYINLRKGIEKEVLLEKYNKPKKKKKYKIHIDLRGMQNHNEENKDNFNINIEPEVNKIDTEAKVIPSLENNIYFKRENKCKKDRTQKEVETQRKIKPKLKISNNYVNNQQGKQSLEKRDASFLQNKKSKFKGSFVHISNNLFDDNINDIQSLNENEENAKLFNELINEIKLPQYQIDTQPLKQPDINIALSQFKQKNKFLFELTEEEKRINDKIKMLNYSKMNKK